MITESIRQKVNVLGPAGLVVGYSGGVDSGVLLHALVAEFGTDRVRAIHVNHGLQSDADDWERLCRRVCEGFEVALDVKRVVIPLTGNLEANARDARYGVFEAGLRANEVLLLAHHRDDQVETILQTLFRGTARFGVVGMPWQRSLGHGHLFRPLLDTPREAILQYAADHALEWIDDPTNSDQSLTRNYLRHALIPAVVERWPSAEDVLVDAARRDEEYAQIIDYAGKIDLDAVWDGAGIDLAGLSALPEARRDNVLRVLLAEFGLPQPPAATLRHGLTALLAAKEDAAPQLGWQGYRLRRFQDRIYLTASLSDVKADSVPVTKGAHEFAGGTLLVSEAEGGLSQRNDYVAKTRDAGMVFRSRHGRSIKKVLQEMNVPPWLRDQLPVLMVGDEVAAIAGLPDFGVPMSIADGFAANPGAPGLKIGWQMVNQPYSH